MKNQYFGDQRDFLKYNLLETLLNNLPFLRQLTCIWLLTAPSRRNDGNRSFRAHAGTESLASFLNECVSRGQRDVRELARYFGDRRYRFVSYGDNPASPFTMDTRDSYFQLVPEEAMRASLVFLDPDNGIEPARSCTEAHVRYSELASVFNRLDDDSIAVVYQHLPRRLASEFWPATADILSARIGSPVEYVATGDVGFYLLPRSSSRTNQLRDVLTTFGATWPRLVRQGHSI